MYMIALSSNILNYKKYFKWPSTLNDHINLQVLSLSYFNWSSLISSLKASFMIIDDEVG
jgi:hypothetical protein